MLIVGNQKAYLKKEKIEEFVKYFKDKDVSSVVIIPSIPFINEFNKTNFLLGSQDVSINTDDNSTGEVTASQLKSLGVKYSLVGHSERREFFKEEKETLIIKINNLLEEDIIPIYCVGETKEEREKNKYKDKVKLQIEEVLNGITAKRENIVIAYEPVWSIGTGLIPKVEEIEEIMDSIKKIIKEKYKYNVKVLYGGSVNANNIEELSRVKDLDGYLIGKASTICEDFLKIINKS